MNLPRQQPFPVRILPQWFRQEIPDSEKLRAMKALVDGERLHTVCESAHCPNLGKCWGQGVATFMILGEVCTRACRFCAVKAGHPAGVDLDEPHNVARAVQQLKLRFVVVTSVARDDLPDEGAGQFAATIAQVRRLNPETRIEVLIPDFSGREDLLRVVTAARPDVISHNIETVRRLSPIVRPQAGHDRSLAVLRQLKALAPAIFVKSGFMAGLGETDDEISELLTELSCAGCDILTIGQYLAPSTMKRHLPVERYVEPGMFAEYRRAALARGIKSVMSGPLVRSSFIAEQGYRECLGILSGTDSAGPSAVHAHNH